MTVFSFHKMNEQTKQAYKVIRNNDNAMRYCFMYMAKNNKNMFVKTAVEFTIGHVSALDIDFKDLWHALLDGRQI